MNLADLDTGIGLLRIAMNYAGTNSGWTAVINGLDIRPITSVGVIAITRDRL